MFKKVSGLFTLSVKDFLRGLIVAVLGAIIGIIEPIIEAGSWVINWNTIWHAAAIAAVAYLAKNFLSNSDGQLLTKEKPKE